MLWTSRSGFEKTCAELSEAIDKGGLGGIYDKLQSLIMHYYLDVQAQAQSSFAVARNLAIAGFLVLIGTLVAIPLMHHYGLTGSHVTFATAGVISGIVIEYIAKIAFDLYGRTAKQFGAFHICLERTHRYLLAYKIAERTTENKERTLHDLVCIMANAPMITQGDIERSVNGNEAEKLTTRGPVEQATQIARIRA